MAKNLRVEDEGAIYHVTVHGNERRIIFRDDGDRGHLLKCMEACVAAYRLRLFLSCLMRSHPHLVVATPRWTWLGGRNLVDA